MSIAVLARKTKTLQRAKSNKEGFVLNMTGRGGGIGLHRVSKSYCNESLHPTIVSKPAPQMSYRTYLNRKSNGAYRPGGKVCCNKMISKDTNVCKNDSNKLASEIIEYNKLNTLKCDKKSEHRCKTNCKLAAKDPCCVKDTVCMKSLCIPYKGRLGYTRINHNQHNSTKNVEVNNCASDHINTVKHNAMVKCKT